MDLNEWQKCGFSMPAPPIVKSCTLLRNLSPGLPVIETGTYLGFTTRLLSDNGFDIFSVELSSELFLRAKSQFEGCSLVRLYEGDSSALLLKILNDCLGETKCSGINIFLDGHYSGGITARGSCDTPVIAEIEQIILFKKQNPSLSLSVLIDDCRCFVENPEYPSLSTLVALLESVGFSKWWIENDMFIAKYS